MALKQQTRENRRPLTQTERPLTQTDLRINRGIGANVLLIGAVNGLLARVLPFNERGRFHLEVTPDGGRNPMTHITCLSPWSVLVDDAEPDVITTDGLCVMPSRSPRHEGGIAPVFSILIAGFPSHEPPAQAPSTTCPYPVIDKRRN